MADFYLWIKAVHVMAVIAWMAGLVYLPRLFVYHSRVMPGSETSELFRTMERKLYSLIMRPAMAVAWLAGIGLAWVGGVMPVWLVVKGIGVVSLTGYHELLGGYLRRFDRDERPASERFFRILNEVPTVLMIMIVIMVIVKPW